VVWIATTTTGSPPGGLWSDASNWETGTVPTATDDVIIITNQLIGLTPSYPVTIDAKTDGRGQERDDERLRDLAPAIDQSGHADVGGAFDMSADSILHNSGNHQRRRPDGGSGYQRAAEFRHAYAQGGGDFAATSTITNTGTIDLSGGTLTVEVDIANTGGIIDVDGAGTLTLDGGAIDGGTIN
jgi:hypothetical protein